MEGERAFIQELESLEEKQSLLEDNMEIAYKYSLGGGYRTSDSWEPLGPAGYYDTFGPELSFGRVLQEKLGGNIAIAKFTHSGSQINDWTPAGSMTKSRHIYPDFIAFIKEALKELEEKNHEVEMAGIFYHLGENDMSMGHYRKNAARWLQSTIVQSRQDLNRPSLKWFVSQQPPTDHEDVNDIDVTAMLERVAAADSDLIHIKAFDLPTQEKKLVVDTSGIVQLGELIARRYLARE
jgi:hypothetical protein